MTFAAPVACFDENAVKLRSLAIEGWRGINHSFALVNQHQMLALLELPGLRLFHDDLPFAYPHWTRAGNSAGFGADEQQRLDTLVSPGDAFVDCVYRIGSPFRAGAADDRRKTVTFMVTEIGLSDSSFEDGPAAAGFFTRDENSIVTPSRWARDRLVDWGFPVDKIEVIAHGVDTAVFGLVDPAQRLANRRVLGAGDDETLFLNVGLPSWNKGIDVLLIAFARLRRAGRKARLVLKDQRDLYGRSVQDLVARLMADHPALIDADTLGAISVISSNLNPAELRALYGTADCYVSPYRAEGFNLPVLEAIACGTPAIVTRGGATDDFCNDDVALRIGGTMGVMDDESSGLRGRYIEPNVSALVEAMDGVVASRGAIFGAFEAGRARMLTRFTWRNAALALAKSTVGFGA